LDAKSLVDLILKPHVVGPCLAVLLIGITHWACRQLSGNGTKKWKKLAAWSVPTVTTVGLLATLGGVISLQKLGLDATANLATVMSVIAGAMCITGQWAVAIAASRTDSTAGATEGAAPQGQAT
jgi:hypothetical protein